MSTMTRPAELWNAMPGWGIAADLTPPELINSRQIGMIRRWLAVGVVAVLLLCVGGYVVASRREGAAARALEKERAQTTLLQSQQHKYAGITKIQGTVSQVQKEVAQLMAGDVALPALLTMLHDQLPDGMSIATETVTVSTSAVATAGTTGTNTSGHSVIGSISISGEALQLVDLATYVTRLQAMTGVVDVLPISNVRADKKTTYNVTLDLTDQLLSHRFDHSISGAK